MKRLSLFLVITLILLASGQAFASISNISITVNGTSGPVTVAPSSSISAVINADITNNNLIPPFNAWSSTRWVFLQSGLSGCSNLPEPDVQPAPNATESGTAAISGITTPSTLGVDKLLFIAYELADCTGSNLTGLPVVTVTIADATPTAATPIPTMSQWALIMLSMLLGLMVFANRRRLF